MLDLQKGYKRFQAKLQNRSLLTGPLSTSIDEIDPEDPIYFHNLLSIEYVQQLLVKPNAYSEGYLQGNFTALEIIQHPNCLLTTRNKLDIILHPYLLPEIIIHQFALNCIDRTIKLYGKGYGKEKKKIIEKAIENKSQWVENKNIDSNENFISLQQLRMDDGFLPLNLELAIICACSTDIINVCATHGYVLNLVNEMYSSCYYGVDKQIDEIQKEEMKQLMWLRKKLEEYIW